MNIRLGPNDCFEYVPRYGVLICRECRYAIQKSALQSHLLRHKIYREERQQLLVSIEQFSIGEPDDVPVPHPTSPPIDGLDVIPGFSCIKAGCGHLCASVKRMRLHHSEVHDLVNSSSADASRPVKLQTFFRGTKIRYFVVTPGGEIETGQVEPYSNSSGENDISDKSLDRIGDVIMNEHAAHPTSTGQKPRQLDANKAFQSVKIDLETLNYFHHFTTVTYQTLPLSRNRNPPYSTQTCQHDFMSLILGSQQEWLMCGILAIAAHHLAATTQNTEQKLLHSNKAKQYHLTFTNSEKEIDALPEPIKTAALQVENTLLLLSSTVPELDSWNIHTFLAAIRSLANGGKTPAQPGHLFPNHMVNQEAPFDHARTIAATRPSNDLTVILDRLETLPTCWSLAFGPPHVAHDVIVTFTAMAFLVQCCAMGFETDDAARVFEAMALWVVEMPLHLRKMVEEEAPAATALVAHWAVFMVGRAEECGCWFLQGGGKKFLREVDRLLRPHGNLVTSLITGLDDQ
ncbi:unnamed protein product [Periconia digitata]|uniref:C2H2-type domain-containing protein n=1 Tax=Periconia digitata TaxID=1303443 RepID=A0A9W4UDH2_9PLEO|nr:unnamed protein product [Periconia digitata]